MKTVKELEFTYNTETGTTMHDVTVDLFTFDELSEDAKNRVVSDYCEERANDPYYWQYFADTCESEIWECVRDLENSISGARVSWSYNRWYSCDFDCEYSYSDSYDPCELEPIENNGYCYSMGICDTWNAHIRKLNAISYRLEYIGHLMEDVYPDWDYWRSDWIEENEPFYNRLDILYSDAVSLWYEELERACDDVRNMIEFLLRSEWEYYTSEEFAREECEDESTQGYEIRTRDNVGRVYYSDCRKWYTENGEFFDQSNINHACVSIVKAG